MVASYALGASIFPIHEMTLIRKTRLTSLHAAAMSGRTKENITVKKVYASFRNIAPMRASPVTDNHNSFTNDFLQEAVERIKENLTSKLKECSHVEELIMIDAIQRLGLEYYFQDDIQAVLKKHYEMWSMVEGGDNLHEAALRFRLLRQQGYDVPADTFSKFKDKDGKFKQELRKDVRGLMSLFEASHLCHRGDLILDDAGHFSGQLLKNMKHVEQSEASIIQYTLGNPHHKSLPSLLPKINFLQDFDLSLKLLHDYNDDIGWINDVQLLARIHVTMAQISYQLEITQLSKWWIGLGLSEDLKHARNQPIKWQIWSLCMLPAPDMAEQRLVISKAMSLIYTVDDIFDVYGSLEKLTLFTEAVEKWDYANVKGLPDYMKKSLKAIYDSTDEMSHKIYNQHGWNPENCLKKVWADLCNAFLVEAKWIASGYLPTTEEYMKNRVISTGVPVAYAFIFFLLCEDFNNGSTDFLNDFPDFISSTASLFRLWNDLGGGQDENQTGYDGSYIACYMKELEGSTVESAREDMHRLISDAWKCLNETCLYPPPLADIKTASMNLARMLPMMYIYDENHRLPSLEKYMKSLLMSNTIEQKLSDLSAEILQRERDLSV